VYLGNDGNGKLAQTEEKHIKYNGYIFFWPHRLIMVSCFTSKIHRVCQKVASLLFSQFAY
jgi:hypothetical protein